MPPAPHAPRRQTSTCPGSDSSAHCRLGWRLRRRVSATPHSARARSNVPPAPPALFDEPPLCDGVGPDRLTISCSSPREPKSKCDPSHQNRRVARLHSAGQALGRGATCALGTVRRARAAAWQLGDHHGRAPECVWRMAPGTQLTLAAVIFLSFVLALGFLLLILSCALWSDWLLLLSGRWPLARRRRLTCQRPRLCLRRCLTPHLGGSQARTASRTTIGACAWHIVQCSHTQCLRCLLYTSPSPRDRG